MPSVASVITRGGYKDFAPTEQPSAGLDLLAEWRLIKTLLRTTTKAGRL